MTDADLAATVDTAIPSGLLKPADWSEVKAFFVDRLPEFEAALPASL